MKTERLVLCCFSEPRPAPERSDGFGKSAAILTTVTRGENSDPLGSILRIRFGRNLRTKLYWRKITFKNDILSI
jgi:hypothetical protein